MGGAIATGDHFEKRRGTCHIGAPSRHDEGMRISRNTRGVPPPTRVWIMTAMILVTLTLAPSCTGLRTETASQSPTPRTGTVSPSPGTAPSAQPVTDKSSFTRALDAAGLNVRGGARKRSELFAVPGQALFVQGVSISTYEYPSEEALNKVRSSISSDGYSVPTRTGGVAIVEWVGRPHFYSAGRLLVLYVGDKQRTLKALETILGGQFAGG